MLYDAVCVCVCVKVEGANKHFTLKEIKVQIRSGVAMETKITGNNFCGVMYSLSLCVNHSFFIFSFLTLQAASRHSYPE